MVDQVPDLSGSLDETPFPEIFSFIILQSLSGILKIEKGETRKEFHFKEGVPVYSYSNSFNELLGQIAISLNIIGQDDLEKALSLAKERGIMTGSAFLEMGKLDKKDLVRLIKLQTQMRIINALKWREGEFRFFEGEEFINDTGIHTSAIKVLSTGILKGLPPERVEERLDAFSGKYPVTLRESPIPLSRIKLEEEYLDFLNSLDGTRRLRDVLSFSSVERGKGILIIYLFHCLGFIEFRGEPAGRGGEPAGEDVGGPDHSDMDGEEVDAEVILEELPLYRSLRDRLAGMENRNHYEVLGLERGVEEERIRETYYELSSEYHPDRHPHVSMKIKGILSEIFERINEAYETLIDGEKRREYDDFVLDGKGKEVEEEVQRILKAEEIFKKGNRLLLAGNLLSAYNAFTDACNLFPGEAEYRLYRAWTLFRLNYPKSTEKMDEAEKEIREIIEENPKIARGYYFSGMIRKAFQDFEAARALFITALKTDPSLVDAEKELRMMKKRYLEKRAIERERVEKEKREREGRRSILKGLFGSFLGGKGEDKEIEEEE